VATEYPAILWWGRKRGNFFEKKKLFCAVLVANIATYAVLAPLHYFATKPIHDIKKFTKDSIWAREPYSKIVFIDTKTKYLQSIDTKGDNKSILVPYETKDYLLSSDMKFCVFRGEQNNLYGYDLMTKERMLLAKLTNRYVMNQVAISPSGNAIGFLKVDGEYHPHRLMIYQIPHRKLIETDYITDKDTWDPVLAWSSREDTLYIKEGKTINAIILGENGAIEKRATEKLDDLRIHLDYGRNGTTHWYGGDDWGAFYSSDTCAKREVTAYSGLESGLVISENKERILGFADNPGLLHLGNRPMGDVLFLPGCEECIFDDHNAIYLLDIKKRRIGKIVDGYRFVRISEKYSKKPVFMREGN